MNEHPLHAMRESLEAANWTQLDDFEAAARGWGLTLSLKQGHVAYSPIGRNGDNANERTKKEGMARIIEGALLGDDPVAYKALRLISSTNPEYAEFLAMASELEHDYE